MIDHGSQCNAQPCTCRTTDSAAVWDQAVEAVATELETMVHYQWNGNPRRPSNYGAAARDARRTPNPYRRNHG